MEVDGLGIAAAGENGTAPARRPVCGRELQTSRAMPGAVQGTCVSGEAAGSEQLLDDAPSWQTHLPRHIKDPLMRFYSEEELDSICRALARPPLTTRCVFSAHSDYQKHPVKVVPY